MTTTIEFMALLAGQIQAANTLAGNNVYTPGDLPTTNIQYPCALVRPASEERESLGRGTPIFTVRSTIEVSFRVAASTTDFMGSGNQAELDCWTLKAQADAAIINNPSIMPLVQQIAETRADFRITAQGESQIAELLVNYVLEHCQGPDNFYPLDSEPLAQVDVTFLNQPPAGVLVTLPQT